MGLLDKLKSGLGKTKSGFGDRVVDIFRSNVEIDDDLYEELEETLVIADVGINTSMEIIERLKEKINKDKIKDTDKIIPAMKEIMTEMLSEHEETSDFDIKQKQILLIVGVNGAGKTTSTGKMAYTFKERGKKVLLVAADTFRAGAIEQLNVWATRANVPIVKQQEGSDPAAVVFDGISAMRNRNMDVLLVDTAGRLHNKKNLMNELQKIRRIIEKESENAFRKTYLVLDGTTGQNAVNQAKEFKSIADLDGIILTKLDGTAKGGVAFAISNELRVPIKYIGVGEGIEDLQEFNAKDYVDAMIGE